ncbi:Avirulence (Avh) protein [Phytophthora megakarya]|uniref:Avirulence (Avh) protein n=1 Tax=Phytophthora megakarya TaxID=4795 RepID=A0A225VN91_9STRA|nr:Avirulence (Avh) protein [Phytophthora megakarya]
MSDIDKAKYLSKLDMTDDNLAKLLGMENMSVAAMKRHPNYNLYYAVTYNVNTRMINKLFKTKTEPSTLWKQLGLPTGETTSVAELKNIKRNDPNFDTYIRYVTKYDKELDAFKTKEQKLLEKYKLSKQFDEDAQPSPELVRMFNVNWDGPDIVYPAEILARADMWAKAGKSDDYVLTMLGMPSLKESSKFAHSYNYKAFLQFKEAAGTLSKNS